jgi:hypothetical protein
LSGFWLSPEARGASSANGLGFPNPENGIKAGQRVSCAAFPSDRGEPPISEPPPRLATGTAAASTAFTSPAYHDNNTASRRADKLVEIENRAWWRDRRYRRARAFGFPAGRVHDLVRFCAFAYGEALPDDDAGREDFFILAHHVVRLNGEPERNIRRYAVRWCPWMQEDELAALVHRVLARPYQWRADTLGERLGLLDSVRTKLGITTIAPIDVSKEEREQRRRGKWNAKRRKQTRADYEGNSISKAEPWKAEGISRAKWYRLRRHFETSLRQQKTLNRRARTYLTPKPKQAARTSGFGPWHRSTSCLIGWRKRAMSSQGRSKSQTGRACRGEFTA